MIKRVLAAVAAVALTAGLSLAAVAGPATADTTATPTPTPVATTATTSTATATPTPSADPTSTPTPTPSSSTPSSSTTDPAPAVAPITFAAAATTQSFSADHQSTNSYITVVWQMPSWNGAQSATWPQTYVSQTAETTETLDVPLPPTCGLQYQIDSYVVTKSDKTALTSFLAAAKAGTKLTDGADNAYLASGGWGEAYTLAKTDACPPPCIPDSQVSYTYNSSTNSGVITVPTVNGSSGVLCQPFYVTATSWKYTTNAVWPQVVDQVDHVNGTPVNGSNGAISASGTYSYGAAVRCGQGDIYASFTSNDATLFPENDGLPGIGYLDGPGNPLPEHFLHQMGFRGPNPTYVQQATSCYSPTVETGSATSTTPVCTGSNVTGSNTLTLQAVPGGVWTVKDGSKYSHTYAIGFGGDATPATINYGDTYTITLADGSSSDNYTVTPYSTSWKPVDGSTLDCNTKVTPVEPAVTTIQQCGVDGSITIPTITGVNYFLTSDTTPALTPGQVITGTGSYTIIAEPAAGYEFTNGSTHTAWTENLGSALTCAVSVSTDKCDASTGVSLVPVWVTLDNSTGSVPSTFEVKVVGTTYDTTFTVAAGQTDKENIGTSTKAGETIDVFINGSSTPTVLTVPSFVDCFTTTVIPADPSVTQATCNVDSHTVNNNASLSVDLEVGLTYSITGPAGFTALTGITGTTGQTVVATGIPAGTYIVTVAALPGFTLDPSIKSPTWPFSIALATPFCGVINATPNYANCPPVDTSTGFVAATTGVPSITVTLNPNIVYTATETTSHTVTVLTAATTDVPAGTYTVAVTLSAAGIAAGYTLPSTGTSFGPWDLTSFCPPTLAVLPWSVSSTDAVCTTDGAQGTITVTEDPAQLSTVKFTVTNLATNATSIVTATTTFKLAPGSYNVRAIPTDTAHFGLVPNTGTTAYVDTAVTIAGASTSCDDGSLAFTGGTIAWFGFVLAGGMLFLGIAFLLMRRRGNRTAE